MYDARLIFQILTFSKNNNYSNLIKVWLREDKGKLGIAFIKPVHNKLGDDISYGRY